MKILVLGLGNTLFGDDGVGIHTVRKLKQEAVSRKAEDLLSGIDLAETSVSGLALLDIVTGYDRLILIDTIKKENPEPGKIRLFDIKDLRHIPGPSPHYVSFPQIFSLGKKAGLKMPSIVKIIAIEAKNIYNLEEGLSVKVERAIPRVIDEIKKILSEWNEREDA
ncbi:MAG: hydrogenase maturation protease [Candidatus Aminicenantia bacterium]